MSLSKKLYINIWITIASFIFFSTGYSVTYDIEFNSLTLTRVKEITSKPRKIIAPSNDVKSLINKDYYLKDHEGIRPSWLSEKVIIVKGVPFHPYWQSGDQVYRFHPMAVGGILSTMPVEHSDEFIRAILKTGSKFKTSDNNEALVWFYSNNYKVNRLLNRNVTSAISQGQILGGMTSLAKNGGEMANKLLSEVYNGLIISYEEGGPNFYDKAMLELPLENSPQEIILNGWVHALIYINEYAKAFDDKDAKELLASNLSYLSDIIHTFHDKKSGLSKYSNLTPYKVKIESYGEDSLFFTVYEPRTNTATLNKEIYKLDWKESAVSLYSNHIARDAGKVEAWLSMSANYTTHVVSNNPFQIEIDPGIFNPLKATPSKSGKLKVYESNGINDLHYVNIDQESIFFTGYPTNFSKYNSVNYYHIYHIVALKYLLSEIQLANDKDMIIRSYIRKWEDTVNTFIPPKDREFAAYEEVWEAIKHFMASEKRTWQDIETQF